jgi:hypothetical protein
MILNMTKENIRNKAGNKMRGICCLKVICLNLCICAYEARHFQYSQVIRAVGNFNWAQRLEVYKDWVYEDWVYKIWVHEN